MNHPEHLARQQQAREKLRARGIVARDTAAFARARPKLEHSSLFHRLSAVQADDTYEEWPDGGYVSLTLLDDGDSSTFEMFVYGVSDADGAAAWGVVQWDPDDPEGSLVTFDEDAYAPPYPEAMMIGTDPLAGSL